MEHLAERVERRGRQQPPPLVVDSGRRSVAVPDRRETQDHRRAEDERDDRSALTAQQCGDRRMSHAWW
jgi:hypothetical protein